MKRTKEQQHDIEQLLLRPSAEAIAVGRREPYHLTYAREHMEVKPIIKAGSWKEKVGGLSWYEMLCVLLDKPFNDIPLERRFDYRQCVMKIVSHEEV